MKLVLLSVGKKNEKDYAAPIEDFTQRLSHYFPCEWVIIPSSKKEGVSYITKKEEEGRAIEKYIQEGDYVIALDERGHIASSTDIAARLESIEQQRFKRVICIIGGAFGLGEKIVQRADYTWSLSKLVFPHQLVRLILAEQLYRAGTIIKKEKYHHE